MTCPYCHDPRPRYRLAGGWWCIACDRTQEACVDAAGQEAPVAAGLPPRLWEALRLSRAQSERARPRGSGMGCTLAGGELHLKDPRL